MQRPRDLCSYDPNGFWYKKLHNLNVHRVLAFQTCIVQNSRVLEASSQISEEGLGSQAVFGKLETPREVLGGCLKLWRWGSQSWRKLQTMSRKSKRAHAGCSQQSHRSRNAPINSHHATRASNGAVGPNAWSTGKFCFGPSPPFYAPILPFGWKFALCYCMLNGFKICFFFNSLRNPHMNTMQFNHIVKKNQTWVFSIKYHKTCILNKELKSFIFPTLEDLYANILILST